MKSLAARIHAGETGATLVIIVVSMMVLIAFAALAIDMGVAYLDVRGSTNAADDAAMAAALQDCNADVTGMTPEAKALEVAEANGYTDGVVVTESDGVWTVSIATASGGIFGSATPAAPDQIDVNTTSSAECVGQPPFLDGMVVFAGGTGSCSGAHLQGGNKRFDGGVHTNTTVHFQGGNTTMNGPITYVTTGGFTHQGPGMGGTFSDTQLPGSIGYPEPAASLTFSQFANQTPSDRQAHVGSDGYTYVNFGSVNITAKALADAGHGTFQGGGTITTEAVYVTTGNIDFNGIEAKVPVTLVAGGRIDISGGGPDFTKGGYWGRGDEFGPGLLAYSTSSHCSGTGAIYLGGGQVKWNGVVFAPNGRVENQGGGHHAPRGSLIGAQVHSQGGGHRLMYDAGPGGSSGFRLRLLGANG